MTYYTASGNPINMTRGLAATVRSEFALIQAGFAMLPVAAAVYGMTSNYGTDSGSANAYVASISSTYITSYADGLVIRIKATAANTGAATVNLNALGLKSIVRSDGTALVAGDIAAGEIVTMAYNSTTGKFHLQGTGPQGTTGATGPEAVDLVVDKGTVATGTVTFVIGIQNRYQKVTASGNITIAVTGWPAAGTYGQIELKVTNFGGRTITWPTISWVRYDGALVATPALAGVTFQTAGTDFVLLWTDDGGTTIYGKVMRG
jgi:hypothetical protein